MLPGATGALRTRDAPGTPRTNRHRHPARHARSPTHRRPIPEFPAAAAAIVTPQTLQQIAAYLPLAAVFRNASTQPLMAYSIRWTVDKHSSPLVGAGGGGGSPRYPAAFLQPGASVLVIPDFTLDREPGPSTLQALQKQEARMQSDWDTAKTIAISLDSAIFASGQFVGPDTINLFAKTAAYATSWRAVDATVQAQITNGVPFITIAAGLQQIRDEPFSGVSQPTVDWIARAQAAEARQLIDLYDKRRTQAVTDLVKRNLAAPVIVVHR